MYTRLNIRAQLLDYRGLLPSLYAHFWDKILFEVILKCLNRYQELEAVKDAVLICSRPFLIFEGNFKHRRLLSCDYESYQIKINLLL
jgi:hypothetical protein